MIRQRVGVVGIAALRRACRNNVLQMIIIIICYRNTLAPMIRMPCSVVEHVVPGIGKVAVSGLRDLAVSPSGRVRLMRQRCHLKRSTRLRLVLLAVVALLFQQVAFAAHVCPLSPMPMTNMAMSAHCNVVPPTERAGANPLAAQHCAFHCAHPTVVTGNAQLPDVPPLLLPPIVPMQPVVLEWPARPAAHARAATERMPGLAPPLKHRVLLI